MIGLAMGAGGAENKYLLLQEKYLKALVLANEIIIAIPSPTQGEDHLSLRFLMKVNFCL